MSPGDGGSWDPSSSSEGGRCGQSQDILTSANRLAQPLRAVRERGNSGHVPEREERVAIA